MICRIAIAFAAVALFHGTVTAQEKGISVTVPIATSRSAPTPGLARVVVSAEQAKWSVVAAGKILGQLCPPSLTSETSEEKPRQGMLRDFYFLLPANLEKGSVLKLNFLPVPVDQTKSLPSFVWKDTPGEHTDLLFGSRPVLRYMYKAYDDSSTEKRNKTYKVFHHLFDPKGTRLVTNGGFTDEGASDPKKLLYPHHRGLQIGFNKITYADGTKHADTWHCPKDDHQSHEGFLQTVEGPIVGRHRLAIDWHGAKKEVIVKEEREMTVFAMPGGTLVEFASRLRPAGGKVRLDGDPQHAGFQFRAHNDVAMKTAKQTYYLRPDGQGKPGETRNWPADKTQVDLPWDAMSFVLDGQRYTVCYFDRPRNSHPERFSERDYGRFGCYFEHDLMPGAPLILNYRIWLQEGEMTKEQVQALSTIP